MAKSIPILVMDEPTAWLDEENIQCMTDVLKSVRTLAEKGVYVFVVTHENALLPAMTRILDV
jgi:ABC-type lipoprotein export system ATPase subunit